MPGLNWSNPFPSVIQTPTVPFLNKFTRLRIGKTVKSCETEKMASNSAHRRSASTPRREDGGDSGGGIGNVRPRLSRSTGELGTALRQGPCQWSLNWSVHSPLLPTTGTASNRRDTIIYYFKYLVNVFYFCFVIIIIIFTLIIVIKTSSHLRTLNVPCTLRAS